MFEESFVQQEADLVFCTSDTLSEELLSNSVKEQKVVVVLYKHPSELYSGLLSTCRKDLNVCPIHLFEISQEDIEKSVIGFLKKRDS